MQPTAQAQGPTGNPGTSLDLDWIRRLRVNEAAVARRVAALRSGGTAGPLDHAGALLRALACTDLTTLADDDTPERVRALCERARHPLRHGLAESFGVPSADVRVAAVCVRHRFLPVARAALAGSDIPVAVVSADFPHGGGPLAARLDEIRTSVAAGADEIDAVIPRVHVLDGKWRALYDEVRAFHRACARTRLKAILATGELGSLQNVARASAVCLMAGADFIKTSTGREAVNATLPVGVVMTRVIRTYRRRTGHRGGFKPAGGLRTAGQALTWLRLVREDLGSGWLDPAWFRLGASSLLADIERELERCARPG